MLRWTHSDPVEPEQLPAAPVRPLTSWRWFLRKVFRFPFCQQHRAWLKAQQDRANAAAKLEDYAVGRSTVAQREAEELNAEKERIANAKELKEAKDKVDQAEKGKQQFVSVFKPTPDKRNDFLKHEDNHPLGANYAYYTEKDFRDLTILTTDEAGVRQRLKQQDDQNEQRLKDEIRERGLPENQTQKLHPDQRAGQDYKFRRFDQNSVRIGGKPLTDAQFAAVALAGQMPGAPGGVYLDDMNDVMGGVRMLYSPIPSFPGELNDPKEMEKFEQYAESIVENEHLAEIEDDLEFYKKVSPEKGTLDITGAVTRYNQKLEQQKQAGALQNAPQKLVQPVEPKLDAQNVGIPEAQQQILP